MARARAGCPPEVGSGLLVNQRVDFEEAMPYTHWQDDYPPLDCAGALAGLIPDIPAGYALAPGTMTTPPIMGDDHVAFLLGEPPEPRVSEDGFAIGPTETIAFEIMRYSTDEINTFRQWFEDNPNSVMPLSVGGYEVVNAPATATLIPGRRTRMGWGLVKFLGDDLILKVNYTGMVDDIRSGAIESGEPDGIALMIEIMNRAEGEGLL